MRNSFIISYDISHPKRWRRVYRILMGVGDPIQFSVFRCELSRSEKVILLEKLYPELNQNEDRVLVVDLGPANSDCTEDRVECWGKPLSQMPDRKAKIV